MHTPGRPKLTAWARSHTSASRFSSSVSIMSFARSLNEHPDIKQSAMLTSRPTEFFSTRLAHILSTTTVIVSDFQRRIIHLSCSSIHTTNIREATKGMVAARHKAAKRNLPQATSLEIRVRRMGRKMMNDYYQLYLLCDASIQSLDAISFIKSPVWGYINNLKAGWTVNIVAN